MSYYFTKKIHQLSFEQAIEHITEVLKFHGFGVITEIDVRATLKKKIDVDFKKYTILGACHPAYAYEALQKEDKIGVFLPCNVVVEESEDGYVEITAVDPIASMQAVNNPELGNFAKDIQNKLKQVIDQL